MVFACGLRSRLYVLLRQIPNVICPHFSFGLAVLSVLSLALIRGELNLIFKWSDEEPEEKKTDNATKTSIISTIIDGHDDGLPDALIDSLYNSAAASRKHCQRGGHEQEQKEVEQAEEDDGDWMKLDQDSDLGHEKKGKKKNTKSAGKKSPK